MVCVHACVCTACTHVHVDVNLCVGPRVHRVHVCTHVYEVCVPAQVHAWVHTRVCPEYVHLCLCVDGWRGEHVWCRVEVCEAVSRTVRVCPCAHTGARGSGACSLQMSISARGPVCQGVRTCTRAYIRVWVVRRCVHARACVAVRLCVCTIPQPLNCPPDPQLPAGLGWAGAWDLHFCGRQRRTLDVSRRRADRQLTARENAPEEAASLWWQEERLLRRWLGTGAPPSAASVERSSPSLCGDRDGEGGSFLGGEHLGAVAEPGPWEGERGGWGSACSGAPPARGLGVLQCFSLSSDPEDPAPGPGAAGVGPRPREAQVRGCRRPPSSQ